MIYVECAPDKVLIAGLGVPKKEIQHERGKGNICNRLKKSRDSLGVIDEDPQSAQPSYLNQLHLEQADYGIKLLSDREKNNHIIVLCPRLEEWLLQAAEEAGVAPGDYNFPDDPRPMHNILAARPGNLSDFVKDTKISSKRLKHLADLLRRYI
jgi:hypothetical protein